MLAHRNVRIVGLIVPKVLANKALDEHGILRDSVLGAIETRDEIESLDCLRPPARN